MLEKQCRLINFRECGDERGNLVVIEGDGLDIPFSIARVFYMYGSDDAVIRGEHANRNSQFVLINVCGTSKVKIDNGNEEKVIELNKPKMGLYIDKMIWKEMYDFSADSILLVLASEHYDEQEYIRNYDEYIKILNETIEIRKNEV